jgi:UDP-GlcNAc:undecaprenyl-phosphate GlcNAc-1-phosphate transferase
MVLAAGVGLLAAGLGISYLLCWLARIIAPRFGLVDKPGGRKAHLRPTPLGGGVAIWLATVSVLVAGALLVYFEKSWLPPELSKYAPGLKERGGSLLGTMVLATLIMLMGLADDRFGLGWKPRFFVQVLLASVFVAFWGRVTLFLPPSFRLYTSALTVLWIVGLTNAFNFLDNMDGLAASVGLIAASLFAAAQAVIGGLFVPAVLLILVGALAGFLLHNFPRARLFMGDAGSNLIGFLLGTLTVSGTFARTESGYSPYSVLAPLLVMAVPLYDSASVILIRLREGRSPFQPDRSHFSHRLVDRGLTPVRAVATIDLVTLTGGLGALLLHRLSGKGALIVVAQTVCLLGLVAVLEVSTTRPERRNGQATIEGEITTVGGGDAEPSARERAV